MSYQADNNQAAIVAALRAAGCSVQLIQGANGQRGVPDLLVGARGPCDMRGCAQDACGRMTYLLEVKRPKVGRLSPAQEKWHAAWRGQVAVVTTVDEALAAVGLRP